MTNEESKYSIAWPRLIEGEWCGEYEHGGYRSDYPEK